MSRVVKLQAPAKVNLILHVLSRRPDGYHELETWMQKLDLYDEVTLEVKKDKGIELYCEENNVPEGCENLAWKAADTFFERGNLAKDYGAVIQLKKNIPIAAGLGGGSSDAGTVLKGLNAIFDNIFSLEELVEMSIGLGADVPFFATDYDAVIARGIGEVMVPVAPLENATFLLVNGGYPVSTRWVFENFALTRTDKDSRMTGSHELSLESLELTGMVNDLEEVTINRYPEIAKVKEILMASGAEKALMSGSGPTVFGVFSDKQKKQQKMCSVAGMLRKKYGAQVFIARSCAGV